jgi:hypothetical protein
MPSSFEHAVISRPEGKANKGMVNIWVGKNSVKKQVKERLFSSLSHLSLITKSVPDRFCGQNFENYVGRSSLTYRYKVERDISSVAQIS